jgi:hypothetical protein
MTHWIASLPLEAFPLLIPESPDGMAFAGYLTCDGQQFAVRVVLEVSERTKKVDVKRTRLEFGEDLQRLLLGFEGALQKKIAVAPDNDLGELLMEIRCRGASIPHLAHHKTHKGTSSSAFCEASASNATQALLQCCLELHTTHA